MNVILVTPPATDPLAWAQSHAGANSSTTASSSEVVLSRSNANTATYAQCVRDIAQRRSLPLVDLFALSDVQQPGHLNPMLCDGLHLSPAGNLELFHAIRRTIEQQLPHIAISQLPLDAPFHGDLTPDNYRELFSVGDVARRPTEAKAMETKATDAADSIEQSAELR